MNPTELARIVVRLVGDGAAYVQMLMNAQNQTKKATTNIVNNITKVDNSISSTFNQRESQLKLFAGSVTSAYAAMAAAISAPILGAVGASVSSFAEFQHAMIESQSIMGDLTENQMTRMRDVAIDMATKWSKSATDMARSFYFLASAGFNAETAIGALPIVERLAVAGSFDMAEATTYASDALKALGMHSEDTASNLLQMTRVSDVLVKANTLANATTRQFALSLTRDAGAALRIVHKDIEEGVAVLAAFADQGIKAETAGNALGRAIRLLMGSAHKSAKEHKRLGFEVYDAAGRMKPMADIIENLETLLGPMSDRMRGATLKALGFEVRMQQAILPLIGMSSKIRGFEADLRKAGGTTVDVANKQMRSFTNQMLRMRNVVNIAAIEIGEILAPALIFVADNVKLTIEFFRHLDPAMKSVIVLTLSMAASILALTVATIVLGKAFNLLFGGVGIIAGVLVVGIFAASVATSGLILNLGGLTSVFETIKKKAKLAWEWIAPVRTAIESLASTVMKSISDLGNTLADSLVSAGEYIKGGLVKAFEYFGLNASQDIEDVMKAMEDMGMDFLDVDEVLKLDTAITWDKIRDIVRDGFLFIEYSFKNVNQVANFAWTGIKLGFIKLINFMLANINTFMTLGLNQLAKNWKSTMNFMWELSKLTFMGPMGITDILSGKGGNIRKTFNELTDQIKLGIDGIEIKALKEMESKLQEEFDAQKEAIKTSFASFKSQKLFDFALQKLADIELELELTLAGFYDDIAVEVQKGQEQVGPLIDEDSIKHTEHELHKLEAAAFSSSEAISRIAAFRQKMHTQFEAEGGGKAGTERADATPAILREIRDILRAQGKGKVPVLPADF